jgi:hypothetical protein
MVCGDPLCPPLPVGRTSASQGIGARGATLSTGIALLDASDQRIVRATPHVWVATDHFLDMHGSSPRRR